MQHFSIHALAVSALSLLRIAFGFGSLAHERSLMMCDIINMTAWTDRINVAWVLFHCFDLYESNGMHGWAHARVRLFFWTWLCLECGWIVRIKCQRKEINFRFFCAQLKRLTNLSSCLFMDSIFLRIESMPSCQTRDTHTLARRSGINWWCDKTENLQFTLSCEHHQPKPRWWQFSRRCPSHQSTPSKINI